MKNQRKLSSSSSNNSINIEPKIMTKQIINEEIKHIQDEIKLEPVKKRGRPKKYLSNVVKQVLQINNNNDNNNDNNDNTINITHKKKDEDIILHLPIYEDDEQDECIDNDKNMFTMKDDTETNNKNKLTSILSISDNSNESDVEEKINIQNIIKELKKKDLIIKKLNNVIIEMKNNGYDNSISATKEYKTTALDLKLINVINGELVTTEKTNIVCWWDTCPFDTMPIFLPDRYYNNKYYVFGCFCSFNCMVAYNLNMDDYRVQIRHSLIMKYYFQLFKLTTPIAIAPQKEILQKFGGNMTIEEFRNKSLLLKKEFKILLPPLIPLIPMIEETTKDSIITIPTRVHQYNKFVKHK